MGKRPDTGSFLVSRGSADTRGGLTVCYRVLVDAQHQYANDVTINPSRSDYDLVDASDAAIGLADDPVTHVGSVYIPPGESSVSVTIVARDDRVVEWDELVSIELLPWDEYRQLHDQPLVVTPNDGLPTSYSAWSWWEARSPYHLKTDEHGEPMQHVAAVTLLDNDYVENHSYQQADQESTELVAETLGYGALQVDVHGGQAQYELPVFAPRYREDDNLRPIVETVIRLPEDVAAATSLSGVFSVGGLAGQEVSFDVTDLAGYLAPNSQRELRLVIPGPESLASSLATGHYDHDIQLRFEIDGRNGNTDLAREYGRHQPSGPVTGNSRVGWSLDAGGNRPPGAFRWFLRGWDRRPRVTFDCSGGGHGNWRGAGAGR